MAAAEMAIADFGCKVAGTPIELVTADHQNKTDIAMVENGGKDWYVITVDYALGYSLEETATNVVKSNGGQIVGGVRHPLNSNDFSSYLLQAQSSGADVIALGNAGTHFTNALKQAAEFGVTETQDLVFITGVHSLGLPTAQGLQFTSAWYWDMNDENRAFAERFIACVLLFRRGIVGELIHLMSRYRSADNPAAAVPRTDAS